MIPRIEVGLPGYFGQNVPENPASCSHQPRAFCMTGKPIGLGKAPTTNDYQILLPAFDESGEASKVHIEAFVKLLIREAKEAKLAHNWRLKGLLWGFQLGGGSTVEPGLRRYLMAVREWFLNDPSCVWNYLYDESDFPAIKYLEKIDQAFEEAVETLFELYFGFTPPKIPSNKGPQFTGPAPWTDNLPLRDTRVKGPAFIGSTLTAHYEIVEDLGQERYRLTTRVTDHDGDERIDREAVVLIDDPPGDTTPLSEE